MTRRPGTLPQLRKPALPHTELRALTAAPAPRPLRALIISATVGAGDAGNARELARRLRESGQHATVRDFLEAAPLGIGKALSKGYEAELRHAPWAYELVFAIWYWCPFLLGPLSRLLSIFTRRVVLRWVKQAQADVVVSTYPIATQVIGDMRRRAKTRWRRSGALTVPAVNVVTDFGYHPFWAHRGIDLNLAVSPTTAAAVARQTGRPSMACAPLTGPKFRPADQLERSAMRAELGLSEHEVAVLISSGSWGIGAVREAVEFIAEAGREAGREAAKLVPVVACGRNEALRAELERIVSQKAYRAVVLGWTDDMAALMAACDVLVENAGGLTSLEALAAGLPIVNFRPIPGHGRKSAAAMAAAGVSRHAHSGADLVEHLFDLGRPGLPRFAQLAAAATHFTADPAQAVAQAATAGIPPPPPPRLVVRLTRVASTVALAGALSWGALTTGVGVAAAAGLGVAHPPALTKSIYVGARLVGAELSNTRCRSALRALGASAVIDLWTAQSHQRSLRALAFLGVDLESGGLGRAADDSGPVAPWSQALSDAQSVQELSALAGRPLEGLVPNRALSAFDLVDAGSAHVKIVVPNATLPLAPNGPFPQQLLALPTLAPGNIYLIEGQQLTPSQLLVLLSQISAQARASGLSIAPFGALQ